MYKRKAARLAFTLLFTLQPALVAEQPTEQPTEQLNNLDPVTHEANLEITDPSTGDFDMLIDGVTVMGEEHTIHDGGADSILTLPTTIIDDTGMSWSMVAETDTGASCAPPSSSCSLEFTNETTTELTLTVTSDSGTAYVKKRKITISSEPQPSYVAFGLQVLFAVPNLA